MPLWSRTAKLRLFLQSIFIFENFVYYCILEILFILFRAKSILKSALCINILSTKIHQNPFIYLIGGFILYVYHSILKIMPQKHSLYLFVISYQFSWFTSNHHFIHYKFPDIQRYNHKLQQLWITTILSLYIILSLEWLYKFVDSIIFVIL